MLSHYWVNHLSNTVYKIYIHSNIHSFQYTIYILTFAYEYSSLIAMGNDASHSSNEERSQPSETAINRRVVLPPWNQCPQISAFIPADVQQRGVIFIDLKSWRLALYPKSRCFRCIGLGQQRAFLLFF